MALKDEPWRLLPSSYRRRIGLHILYSDMDAFRHLNNGATGRYLEEGRAELNIQVFGASHMVDPLDGWQLLFANVTIDYLRQARYPGTVSVASAVGRVGHSSYVIAQAAFQEDQCFALAQSVMVKARNGRSEALSEAERATLAQLQIVGAVGA